MKWRRKALLLKIESTYGTDAVPKEFEGINKHHYWVVAEVR